MKKLLVYLLLLVHTTHAQPAPHNANEVLQKLADKLKGLQTISYEASRELNYSSENYHNQSSWTIFCDFTRQDTLAGFRYQVEDGVSKQIFNGSELFDLNKKDKSMQVNDQPKSQTFQSISAFYNSIVTLKNVIPLLLADKGLVKEVRDSSNSNGSYYVVSLNVGKRRIQNLGKAFDAMQTSSVFIYRLIIDKNTLLPLGLMQLNDLNADFIKTSFTKIEVNPPMPAETSWYYSSYASAFKPAATEANLPLLEKGTKAPSWSLLDYAKNTTISSDELKGRVTVLDFWIKNCGPCIQSVPHLNALQAQFKSITVVGINAYDSVNDVDWFCKKHGVEYKVVLNGRKLAEQFGIDGYPTIFIIDKSGRIAYAHTGYDAPTQAIIEAVIKGLL